MSNQQSSIMNFFVQNEERKGLDLNTLGPIGTCPVCGGQVPIRKINQHLDEPGQCPGPGKNCDNVGDLVAKAEVTVVEEDPVAEQADSATNPLPSHVAFTESKKLDPKHIPYYVGNFEVIVTCVVEDSDDAELLCEKEVEFYQRFKLLNLDAKKAYVRLFQRKHAWLTKSQFNYTEILDLDQALADLIEMELVESGDQLNDLETLLGLLSAPNIKTLAKEMMIRCQASQKADIIKALVSLTKQKSVFFKPGTDGVHPLAAKLQTRAKKILGFCFRVSEASRVTFLRIMSLYSLTNFWTERETESGQRTQLTTTLLVNQGKMTFPSYEIIRKCKIFRDRTDLLKFEEGCALEDRMSDVFEAKDWSRGLPIAQEAMELFKAIGLDQDYVLHVTSLPCFLRRFTVGSVLAYVLTKSVEVFERQKMYQDATQTLKVLVQQDLYLPDYHGHWYERLVLDLDQHLKQPGESLQECRRGLDDPQVRVARKLALFQRVLKICQAKKNTHLKAELESFTSRSDWSNPKETPKVVIQGKMMTKDNIPGAKTVFVHKDGDSDIFCSVEDFVIYYYKDLGYIEGLHAEGVVVNTICFILFWDVVYDSSVPDAFRSPNQARPLDFDTDDFYANRKEAIELRLSEIETMTEADLVDDVNDTWTKRRGITSLVHWDLFQSPGHLVSLIKCFTRKQLTGIMKRLICNHRFTRSGFPDLTVWDPKKHEVKIIEVKGPNDKLSNKQILWIEFLNSLGIDAFVCHVEASGARGDRVRSNSARKEPSAKPAKRQKVQSQAIIDEDDDDFV